MIKQTRNPRFKDESRVQISWTRVVKGKYPHRQRTLCCSDLASPGDIVVTLPVLRDGVVLATGVVHERCLRRFLEEVPDDTTGVRNRWEHIKARFAPDG